MNLKNMRRLRARLRSRKNPVGFEMQLWLRHNKRFLTAPAAICRAAEKHPCGTAACVAGHAALIAWQSGDMPKERRAVSIQNVAADWLGLDDWDARSLFTGNWENIPHYTALEDITKAQAITELTRLIDAETAPGQYGAALARAKEMV